MNDFKKSLLASTAKVTDEEIIKRIGIALESLKDKVEGNTYKQQIQDRKEKILNLLISFNTNRDIIEKNYKCGVHESGQSHSTKALDKVVSNIISTNLDMFYEETKLSIETKDDIRQIHSLCVIAERRFFIAGLFEDFDAKMQYLQKPTQNPQPQKTSARTL